MRRLHAPGVLLLAIGILLAACGDEPPPPPQPTKEALVQTLRDLLAALEAGDNEAAFAHLVPLPGMQPEDVPLAFDRVVERDGISATKRKDISAVGIDILAQEGVFGELGDLFGERGKGWAARAGVNKKQCYALVFDDAEVAALWNGTAFQIIHLDDVRKPK